MVAVPTRFVIIAPRLRRTAIVLWIIAVALLPLGFVGGGPPWLAPVPSLFIALVAWAAFWRPRIELTPETLRVVDVRRTSTYAWPRVLDVKPKYGLEIVSSEGERRTWVAPRPTVRLAATAHGGHTAAESFTVESAATRIRASIPARVHHDGPPPAHVQAAPIRHRTHGWTVLAMIILGIAATISAAQL